MSGDSSAVSAELRRLLELLDLGPDAIDRIRALESLVDRAVAPEYRRALFERMLPLILGATTEPASGAGPLPGPTGRRVTTRTSGSALTTASERRPEGIVRSRLNLSRYAVVLASSGRTLLKALVALDAGAEQLAIDWMSPAEIERFLVDRARVRSAYRTNISNALSGARPLADRRRRGRGYEYRLTLQGKEALERELAILGTG